MIWGYRNNSVILLAIITNDNMLMTRMHGKMKIKMRRKNDQREPSPPILISKIIIKMTKRIVTRIGNIFCVEISNEYKCYFQYVAIDKIMLNSSTIRVFKKRYDIEENPKIEYYLRRS